MMAERFADGQRIRGAYGNVWERQGGSWRTPAGGYAYSDATMAWLLDLHVKSVATHVDNKISKSLSDMTTTFEYRFALVST